MNNYKCSFKECILGLFRRNNKESTVRDAIEELIEEDQVEQSQSIAKNEREMIGNVLNLRDIQVQDIMIPRVSVIAVSTMARIEEIISQFVENKINTLLVYQGTTDNILGVIKLKDVANWFHMNKPFNINLFIKEVLFVPPTMKTLDLLFKMKETGNKIAVIIDEYGGVDGLVSFIDLIEEIVGDIQDVSEIKHQKNKIIKSPDGSIIADGKSTFDEVQKYGNIKIIPDDDSNDTIGGMLSSILGRVPVRGELISIREQNLEFEILDADPRKIKKVKIRKI